MSLEQSIAPFYWNHQYTKGRIFPNGKIQLILKIQRCLSYHILSLTDYLPYNSLQEYITQWQFYLTNNNLDECFMYDYSIIEFDSIESLHHVFHFHVNQPLSEHTLIIYDNIQLLCDYLTLKDKKWLKAGVYEYDVVYIQNIDDLYEYVVTKPVYQCICQELTNIYKSQSQSQSNSK